MQSTICCIGHTTIDKVITRAETVIMPGGTSIYFSSAMAGLDMPYLLVTALAEGDLSVLDILRDRGVEMLVFSSPQTMFFVNEYGADSNERTQKVLQVAAPFTTGQVAGVNAAIYHLGTLSAGDIPQSVINILATKGLVSLDVQGCLRKIENESVIAIDWNEKEEVLPLVHYLKASEEEMAILTGTTAVERGAKN